MRCWTVSGGSLCWGIVVDDGHIVVGESGRGRKRVRVPLPPMAVMESDQRPGGAACRLVECGERDDRALVLIRDQSGFRGSWAMFGPVTTEQLRALEAWRDATYTERASLERPTLPAHRLEVIAQGLAAQGAAGRMGSGPEYLVVMRPGDAADIARAGRLYGAPSLLRLRWTGTELTLTDVCAAVEEETAAGRLAASLGLSPRDEVHG